ncbi:MAG: GNAT family N-acetyltransferase [Chthoniobacteraceae bacterium]
MKPKVFHRPAVEADLDLLAEWNQQLIQDESHRNTLSVPELRDRMAGWLEGAYCGVIFMVADEAVGYALYREYAEEIYLRHFFIRRCSRRKGLGRTAMALLIQQIWPPKRLTVEALYRNPVAIAFWKAMGFEEYSICFEIPAQN